MNRLLCFLMFLVGLSCTDQKPIVTTTTVIVNNSGVPIEYISYEEGASSDTIYIGNNEHFSYEESADNHTSVYKIYTDSIKVVFNQTNSSTYRRVVDDKVIRNPLFYDAYEEKIIGENHYQYIYTITEEDYNNATSIE